MRRLFFAVLLAVDLVSRPAAAEDSEHRIVARLPDGVVLGRVSMPAGQLVRLDPSAEPGPVSQEPEHAREKPRLYLDRPLVPLRRTGPAEYPQTIETRIRERPHAGSESLAGASLVVARNSVVPIPAGYSSTVNEPNVGSQGDGIFMSGNWYGARSVNNGATWSVLPWDNFPRSPFPFTAGACCDQRVAQDSTRDLIIWYIQYLKTGSGPGDAGGFRIAVANGQAGLASNTWRVHSFTPASFGLPPNTWFDYPTMEVSSNYLYFTTGVLYTNDTYHPISNVVGRIPLANLANGTPFVMDTVGPLTSFPVKGATDTMWFLAVGGGGVGTMRLTRWREASAAPDPNSFIQGIAPTGYDALYCPTPDGLNPCGPPGGFHSAAWLSPGELGVMWHSSPTGPARPHPFIRVLIVDPAQITPGQTYTAGTNLQVKQPDMFSTSHAWMYPSVSVNARGHLGGSVYTVGGGLYAGIHALVRDELSPDPSVAGWETQLVARGNAGQNGRMGDFTGSAVHEKHPNTWLGIGKIQVGGPTNSNTQVRNFWLMRQRDVPGAHVNALGPVSVLESAGTASVSVALTTSNLMPTTGPVSLAYATADGTAAAGADYQTAAGTLTWPAGTPSGTTRTVTVTLGNDALDEGFETIRVVLSNAAAAYLDTAEAVVTILDDDPKTITPVPGAVVEGNAGTSVLALPLRLSNPSGLVVELDYATTGGTAQSGSDYTPVAATLSFPSGATERTASVPVTGDTMLEPNETVVVGLVNPRNGVLAASQTTGTILDDDQSLSLYSVTPCRVVDTRDPTGPWGGPALAAGTSRNFTIVGRCAIPATARAVSLNLTATQPTNQGNLRLHPGRTPAPLASVVNFGPAQTRANNAVVMLGPDGDLDVRCGPAGSVHVILDVNGYFE
jgi:hypothetical protein